MIKEKDRGRLQISSPLFCISNAQLLLYGKEDPPLSPPTGSHPPIRGRRSSLRFDFDFSGTLPSVFLRYRTLAGALCALFPPPQWCKLNEVTRLKVSFEFEPVGAKHDYCFYFANGQRKRRKWAVRWFSVFPPFGCYPYAAAVWKTRLCGVPCLM